MPILCNCCGADNAPLALHKNYWICEDCLEYFGSYDAALNHIKNKSYKVQQEKK